MLRRVARSMWAYSLLVVCAVTLGGGGSVMAQTAVFTNHTEGYACYRIPAMVRTPAGALLAFAEARKNSCSDFGDVRIVMRRSSDEGKTWSGLETVAENGSLQAGNPVPVVDLKDRRYPHGRILLVYCTGDAPEDAVMRGEGARKVWVRASTDDGATWSRPEEITGTVKLPSWHHYATGPGHGLLLLRGAHAGRIVIAANHSENDPQPNGRAYDAHSFYSDDHGSTWHLGSSLHWPGSNEDTAAKGRHGAVVMNIRDQSGASRARIIAISKDGGGHWDQSFVAKDLPDPVCEGSMLDYDKGGRHLLIFGNAGNTKERRDLTISVSRDEGRTWPIKTVVAPGPAAYSDMALLKDDDLGVLWERGNSGGIFFMALPVAPLLHHVEPAAEK